MPSNGKILIVMDGGIIQDILGIPEGVTITIRDYDVEHDQHADLEEYARSGTLHRYDGALCLEQEWDHEVTDDEWDPATPVSVEELE